jgi:hypothetical protein
VWLTSLLVFNFALNGECFSEISNTYQQGRSSMKRLIVSTITIALLTGAAALKWVAAAEQRQGTVFIAGDRPVTEDEVRNKLQADGWSNVRIERDGKYFGVSAVKNGQTGKLAIDSLTGRLRDDDDDEDDDD